MDAIFGEILATYTLAALKEASNEAKRLRRETELAPGEAIKTMFAANELEAEDLLNQPPKEDLTPGEDY